MKELTVVLLKSDNPEDVGLAIQIMLKEGSATLANFLKHEYIPDRANDESEKWAVWNKMGENDPWWDDDEVFIGETNELVIMKDDEDYYYIIDRPSYERRTSDEEE